MGTTVFATDRFFSDISKNSPNGMYSAEAISPENKEGAKRSAFQEDFTVTFKDANTGQTVWTWHQEKEDASPVELIPTDDGKLVMQDAYDRYRVFDNDGAPSKPVSAFLSIPEVEIEKYTDWTTAGVMWQQYAKQGFYKQDSTTYFYLRTYWGHIFAISMHDGKEIKDRDLLENIEAHVVAETKQWIKGFDDVFFFECPGCGGQHLKPEITAGLFIIRKHKIWSGWRITRETLKKTDDNRNSDLKNYLDRL